MSEMQCSICNISAYFILLYYFFFNKCSPIALLQTLIMIYTRWGQKKHERLVTVSL